MKGAIITPFRNRQQHLDEFIPHYRKLLPDMNIYVIEQDDDKGFNRAKLFNIGFDLFSHQFDYFIAHDVDLLGEDIDYSYSDNVVQLGTRIEQFGYKMPYPQYLGGVTLFPNDVFRGINGYDNNYYGWSAEDDSIYKRLKERDYEIEYRDIKYKSLPHERIIDHEIRKRNVSRLLSPIDWTNGLSNLDFDIAMITEFADHTHVKVKL